MTRQQMGSLLVDAADATDAALCGGKALGLARLGAAGFAVPAALCLTTTFYRRWLETSGAGDVLAALIADPRTRDQNLRRDLLGKARMRVETAPIAEDLWPVLRDAVSRLRRGGDDPLAVRSSAPYEDDSVASHAGVHASYIVRGHDIEAVASALRACWASLWTETAWAYRERIGVPHAAAAMAVIVQRFVVADRSGIAFSVDPLTGDPATVMIEAGRGTGAALVSGRVTPDEYRVVDSGGRARVSRRPGRQHEMTVWRDGQEMTVAVPEAWRGRRVLRDDEAAELARLVKRVERALGMPVDVEWTFDGMTFWAVQARPITTLGAAREEAPAPGTVWTRANLKEVFPELPSPLALSYLAVSLNGMFRSYHAAQGYVLPPDARLVGVFLGRPYLNLSLMQRLAIERGGDPAVVGRLLGGGAAGGSSAPASPGAGAVPGTRRRWRLAREMMATFFRTPYRGRRLFRALRRQSIALRAVRLDRLDDVALIAHLDAFRRTMLGESMMRRLHEVVSAQSRAYMALEAVLTAWIPGHAETLVKHLMTGLGTLPNVRMTYRLMELGALAVRDPRAAAFFASDLDAVLAGGYETALAGTTFLDAFREFLKDFGHRGPFESDVMSARYAEDPTPVFRLIQLYVRAGGSEDPARHAAERRRIRRAATAEVRAALRRGRGRLGFAVRWSAFSIMCRALQNLLALRDECRHVTTLLVTHLRAIALEIGRRAVVQGSLASADDAFFLLWDELPVILADRRGDDWRAVTLRRRGERERHARCEAPNLLGAAGTGDATPPRAGDELLGFGVSPGTVQGTVRVLRSVADAGRLSGEIIVSAAIEPTLATIYPLLGGVVTEMGGLLSHAAILAREYGLPAVVNVEDATRRLHDGDRVELDGTTGRVRVLERAG